jgi:hypothetical protein
MALRIARGLSRLWLVLSVLWIGGVGVVTWLNWPEDQYIVPPSVSSVPSESLERRGSGLFDDLIPKRGEILPALDPSKPYTVVREKERWEAVRYASIVALVPPLFVLALGSALIWAFRGFR